MPDLLYLVSKWWKQMLAIVLLSLAAVCIVLYLKPSKYLSTATALPASSYATDKASVFNANIQQLYSAMGTPDDLDMIVGTAHLDTIYLALAAQADLAGHYKVEEQGDAAIRKAAFLLKANTKVIKSEYSELKVKVWDKDKAFAPMMANAIMDKLQSIHQDIQNSNNVSLIKSLQSGKEKIQAAIDSINSHSGKDIFNEALANSNTIRKTALFTQVEQYEKLISEYQLLVDNKTPVLIIVDKARVTDWPDAPKRMPVLAATFVLSFLFSLLLILLIEKRKSAQQ
jgi:LPS O-antigen subunit length determinant protein (WzzB/FepE family)